MLVMSGRAYKGAGVGGSKPVMGHAWWHWLPSVEWLNMPMEQGRMRGVQMRWFCFWWGAYHLTPKEEA